MRHEQVADALNEVVGYLRALAPANWKRIFLTREMEDHMEWGFRSSLQLYAIKKPLFAKAHVQAFLMPHEIGDLLDRLGRYYMEQGKQNYVTLDLLIWDSGRFRAYMDYGPLQRLGGDLNAALRHKRYAEDDPLLLDVRERDPRAPEGRIP